MIIHLKKKILIVPASGVSADDADMASLKEKIEASGNYVAMIADIRSDSLELSRQRLYDLCSDREMLWEELPEDDEPKCTDTFMPEEDGELEISLDCDNFPVAEWGRPDVVVVFGKSAMFADGLEKTDVLFINPEYDSEWPWKKIYYQGRKTASSHYDECLVPSAEDEVALSYGVVAAPRYRQPDRYALFTSREAERKGKGEFEERYPRLSMTDTSLRGNGSLLAATVCAFADGNMDIPLAGIEKALASFPRIGKGRELWAFPEPVKLEGFTATGLSHGVPMANRQSGIRVCVAEREYDIPIESFSGRHDLAALRDATVKAREALSEYEKSLKRIMIVPDYFTPCDSPIVTELRDRLKEYDYRVTVFCAGEELEKSRSGLERICKRRKYDLIVTLETGCLLAARINYSDRIFVNPDWSAWEWMERMLGDESEQRGERGDSSGAFGRYCLNRDEIASAREMARRYSIRKGDKLSMGWFTSDLAGSHMPEAHTERFNSVAFPPHIALDSESGISHLAKQIHSLLDSMKEE